MSRSLKVRLRPVPLMDVCRRVVSLNLRRPARPSVSESSSVFLREYCITNLYLVACNCMRWLGWSFVCLCSRSHTRRYERVQPRIRELDAVTGHRLRPPACERPDRPALEGCCDTARQAGGDDDELRIPAAGMGRCRGSRFGEVVSVIANPVKPVVTTSTDSDSTTSVQVDDANIDACLPATFRYTSLAMAGREPAPILTSWYQISPSLGVAASSPPVRQQTAGSGAAPAGVHPSTSRLQAGRQRRSRRRNGTSSRCGAAGGDRQGRITGGYR